MLCIAIEKDFRPEIMLLPARNSLPWQTSIRRERGKKDDTHEKQVEDDARIRRELLPWLLNDSIRCAALS